MLESQQSKVEFEIELFDDESTREKLTVMNSLEVMFDDERNTVPDEYYQLVDVPPGARLRITVERVK